MKHVGKLVKLGALLMAALLGLSATAALVQGNSGAKQLEKDRSMAVKGSAQSNRGNGWEAHQPVLLDFVQKWHNLNLEQ